MGTAHESSRTQTRSARSTVMSCVVGDANGGATLRPRTGLVKRRMGLISTSCRISVGQRGLEVSSGEGSMMGIPLPVKICPMRVWLSNIHRVTYVGFGGPLFSIRIFKGSRPQDYVFEARTQLERNIWVHTIKQWIRNP